MCFLLDDYVTQLASKVKAARKVHRCSECRGEIAVGQRYRSNAVCVRGRIQQSQRMPRVLLGAGTDSRD